MLFFFSLNKKKPGAGEERYAAFCAECEDSEKNGSRHLRPPYFTVKSQVDGDMD